MGCVECNLHSAANCIENKPDPYRYCRTGKYFSDTPRVDVDDDHFCDDMFCMDFFRAENVTHAISYVGGIFSKSLFTTPVFEKEAWIVLGLSFFMIVIEWMGRESKYALEHFIDLYPKWLRWCFYAGILFLMGMFMQTEESPFIYFQF